MDRYYEMKRRLSWREAISRRQEDLRQLGIMNQGEMTPESKELKRQIEEALADPSTIPEEWFTDYGDTERTRKILVAEWSLSDLQQAIQAAVDKAIFPLDADFINEEPI